MTTNGINTISKALSNLSELRTYSMYNNYCTKETSDAIASVIMNNINLKCFNTSVNNFLTCVVKIGNALRSSILITELNLEYSNISEKAASSLALALSHQYNLEEFTLEGNYLGITGIITVAKSLSAIHKIKLLNLDNTFLTEESLIPLVWQ